MFASSSAIVCEELGIFYVAGIQSQSPRGRIVCNFFCAFDNVLRLGITKRLIGGISEHLKRVGLSLASFFNSYHVQWVLQLQTKEKFIYLSVCIFY